MADFYIINNFLTLEECQEIIGKCQEFQKSGYHLNGETVFDSEVRVSKECSLTLDWLKGRIEKVLENNDLLTVKSFRFSECSEKLRVIQYPIGGHFQIHRDHVTECDKGTALFNFLIYLEECQGGETFIFLDEEYVKVEPEVGKLLLFYPNLKHAANSVEDGQKTVVKGCLFYQKK